jgi:opacity protein-like surface antigen
MKKILLFSMLVLSLAVTSNAQTKQWKIAIVASPNVSWIKPDAKFIDPGANKLKFGFGLCVDKMFTDNYAFGTGFNVLNTGGQLKYKFDGQYTKDDGTTASIIGEKTRTYKLQYVELPLTLKLRTNEIGFITYWGQIGLGLGLNIKAKGDEDITYLKEKVVTDAAVSWNDTKINQQSLIDEDIKDDIRLFRVGFIAAAGMEYNLAGSTSIVAGLSYNNAITNVLNSSGVQLDSAGRPVISNQKPLNFNLKGISNSIALNVGVLF